MEFRVLGQIEVCGDDGRRLAVASGRQAAILAYLLIHANRAVPAERIVDELWGDEPPETGVKAVAFHVSRLRDALEPGRPRGKADGILATEPGGYVLRAEPGSIDAVRFERLAAEGRARLADDPEAGRALLREALALWRGAPYADAADEPFAQPEIARLEELHLRAREDGFDAELAMGRHGEVVEELGAFVAENPLRERARGQLMVALYRAGRQAEALRAYADGRRVLADELGIDPGPELAQLEGWILRQDPRLEPLARRRAARNPYKGLRPFGEEDSDDYFGREALVARLVERLGEVARAGRFLALVGPSGSGKSSAVRAGLLPALRAGALPGSDRWAIALMLPGARPFRELAAALKELEPEAAPDVGERLERDGDLAGVLATIRPRAPRILLVVDQLEELFSLVEEGRRARFVAALGEAVSGADGRLVVAATLRADFLGSALLEPDLGELLRSGTELATPLDRDELERAIARPAEAVGVQLEPGLAAEVIADVGRQPGTLPLLQYALTELFERSDGRRLTCAAYEAVGGVLGALGRRADEVYESLDVEGREVARQAFLRLAVPGSAGEPAARRVPRAELRAAADDPRRVDEAIDAFGRRRLLSFDRDATTGEPTVQVAHEALLVRWERLATWIDEEREDLLVRRRLADAAAEWERSGRDPGFLLSGSRLQIFASWSLTTDLRLDAPERGLLEASVAEQRRQDDAAAAREARERALERRSATRLRALVAVLGLTVVLVGGLLFLVYGQGEASREQADVATARELAAASIASLATDPHLGLVLAWHAADATAGRGYVVEQAMDALHWALQESHVAYPAGDAPTAVHSGPDGPRGVTLLDPDRLMDLAAATAGGGLTTEQCRTYLHREMCPAPSTSAAAAGPLDVYTPAGVVPAEQLAGATLTGTGVDLVAQLPVDLARALEPFEAETGIGVAGTEDEGGELAARVASGDPPDIAIVERPADVADLARRGLLVDLADIIDVPRLRAVAGDYLVGLGTVAANGTWPADDGLLAGAPMAVEAESLVWYPKAAFERAGYEVPGTWAELEALTAQMIADGHTPWCLGLAEGMHPASGAVDVVEDLVLHGAGPATYDEWAAGSVRFGDEAVSGAFAELGDLVFDPGSVLGGADGALATQQDLAAWPMFFDPPGCWLHLAGGAGRGTWPNGASDLLAAFPFPPADAASAGAVRGRVFDVVVFRDRPEVRRLVTHLVGEDSGASLAGSLVPAGIWPVASAGRVATADEGAAAEGELLRSALDARTFRVAASDLMPAAVADAFVEGTVRYVARGRLVLASTLQEIQRSWRRARQ